MRGLSQQRHEPAGPAATDRQLDGLRRSDGYRTHGNGSTAVGDAPPQTRVAEPNARVRSHVQFQRLLDGAPRVVAQAKLAQVLANRGASRPVGRPSAVLQPRTAPASRNALPAALRSGIETLAGVSMGDVSVEYDSPQPRQLQALAYAQGATVRIAPGQEAHLAHEAWHVAQQKQGRVKATARVGGVAINDDSSLEREADVMGERASRTRDDSVPGGALEERRGVIAPPVRQAVVQRQEGDDSKADDLSKMIFQFKELAAKAEKTQPASALLGQLDGYIAELEGIAAGGDPALIAVTATALGEAVEKYGSGAPQGLDGPAQEIASGNQDIVQGFGLDPLLLLIGENPKIAIGTALVIGAFMLERVVAAKKRKTLPRRLSGALFTNDRQAYWVLVVRKIDEFCRANKVGDQDKVLMRQAALGAIEAATDERNFLGSLLTAAILGVPYSDPQVTPKLGPWGSALIVALENDVLAVAARVIQTPDVPHSARGGFSNALKRMPYVAKLFSGQIQANMGKSDNAWKKVNEKPNWHDATSIADKIGEVDDGYRYLTRDRSQVDDGRFRRRVIQAERFIRQTVEPAIINKIPAPAIKVHLRNQQSPSNPLGFRAYQSKAEVHVAQDESVSVIAHELGHYIEDNLSMVQWSDIELLLQGRNRGQGKGGYIYPHSYREQRFSGDYPATGKYTSKYYEGGSTEVMSMSLEYLSHPEKFKDLIAKDPQQAALILRLLRPVEFAATTELNPYLRYLPQ